MSKTHIKVWLTKNTKQIRARITEETEGVGNYTYEVVVTQTGAGCANTASGIAANVVEQPVAASLNMSTPVNNGTLCIGGEIMATFNQGTGGLGCSENFQYSIKRVTCSRIDS